MTADSFPLLANLKAVVSPTGHGTSVLRVGVRFGEDMVALPGEKYELSIFAYRAILRLDLVGLDVVEGTRLNDTVRRTIERTVSDKRIEKSDTSIDKEAGVDSSLGTSPAFNLVGSIKGKTSDTTSSERVISTTAKEAYHFVRPTTGNRWEIAEPDNKSPLNANYLSEEALCEIRSAPGANRAAATVALTIRKRDLQITVVPASSPDRPRKPYKNRPAAIAALIAKAMGREVSLDGDSGVVVLSRIELEHEPDANT